MLNSGYAYELVDARFWNTARDDQWEHVLVNDVADAVFLGERYIDGSLCRVYSTDEGVFAQSKT